MFICVEDFGVLLIFVNWFWGYVGVVQLMFVLRYWVRNLVFFFVVFCDCVRWDDRCFCGVVVMMDCFLFLFYDFEDLFEIMWWLWILEIGCVWDLE